MFEWSRRKNSSNINENINSSGLVTSTNNVDLLAEEKNSLRLILDTLNDTLDYKYAKRRDKDNNNNNNNFRSLSRSSGVIATDVEMVELLSMLPRVLQGAVVPAVMKEKEEQRELMTIYNIPRSPPFSRYTILYRLLFSPLLLVSTSSTAASSSSLDMTSSLSLSSPSTGESDVLNCIARVLIYNCGLSTRESSVLIRQSKLHQIVMDRQDKPMIGESITIASLHSLSDILHLCLNNNNDDDEGKKENEKGVCMTQMLLRDALRHALFDSGLYEYLWRSLLFHPIPDVLRGVMGEILSLLSHSNVLRLPAVMTATRQSISPAVWGERIAQCILSDPLLTVKESLITILHEGLVESISANNNNNNNNKRSNVMHWKRWMTNTSLRYLLSVLATGTPVNVLRPLLDILTLALEVELREYGKTLQRSVGQMLERFHLVIVVEVCTTRLLSVFTGPNAVNRRKWTGKDDEEELIYYRLLVEGLVHLLRLVLKGVDMLLLLGRLNNSNNYRNSTGISISTDMAVKEATLVLRTCVEKQLMAVLLKCLEEQYQQQQEEEKEQQQQQKQVSLSSSVVRIHTFSTRKMRAEMIRLLRDLIERATPPLFYLIGRFTPYFPMMMQSILSGAGNSEFPPSCGYKQQQKEEEKEKEQQKVNLYNGVCSENVEMVALLAVLLCYSSQMRVCFLDTLSALHCTYEQCQALFDVMEATAQLLPVYAVEELLVIDITGTVINMREGVLESKSVECIFYHQEEEKEQQQELEEETWSRKKRGNDQSRNSEACWVSIQQQRRKLTAQNSHFTCTLVYLILHHLRRTIMKEMSNDYGNSGIKHRKEEKEKEKEEEEADGVSLSPIQPSVSVSTGSTRIAIVSNTHADDIAFAVEDNLKKNTSNRRQRTCEETFMTPSHSNVLQKWKYPEAEEEYDLYYDGRKNTYDHHSIDYTHSSISTAQGEQEEQEWQIKRKTRLVMLPSSEVLNMNEMLRRVRHHQMETTAEEEKTYHAALDMFATLGSRYYRHALTPQAAVEYVKRHEHKGSTKQYHNKPFITHVGDNAIKPTMAGRRNYNTILRLWTGQDVRKEDLFFFSLPIKEINAEAIIALISRCRKHQEKLRRVLRTTPQTPRGRRWFLEDAATNIMGRLIALFNILLLSIQQEGEKAIQEAFTHMPEVCDKEEMVLKNSIEVNHNYICNVLQKELHCGTVVDMTKFIVGCFSLPVELTV